MQTFPVVQYLKTRDPACTVHWVVEEEYAGLVRAHPDVDGVLTVTTRKWRSGRGFKAFALAVKAMRKTLYDAVFDLQGNTKSGLITALARAKEKVGFAWKVVPEWPNCLVTTRKFSIDQRAPIQRQYLSIPQQFFKDKTAFQPRPVDLILSDVERALFDSIMRGGTPRVMVAFASRWENKTLAFEAWVDVLQGVRGPFYFVAGGGKEIEMAKRLAASFPGSQVLEKLPFPVWQQVMGKMELVIGVDSAALALCGLTEAPTFSFFGPTEASVYKPIGARHRHFQGSCPYGVRFEKRCPKLRTCATGACLRRCSHKILSSELRESSKGSSITKC